MVKKVKETIKGVDRRNPNVGEEMLSPKEILNNLYNRWGNCLVVQENTPVAYDQATDTLRTGKVIFTIASDPKREFCHRVAPSESMSETLVGLGTFNGNMCPTCKKGPVNKILIRRIVLISTQQCKWDVMFWSKKGYAYRPIEDNGFCGAEHLKYVYSFKNLNYYDSGLIELPYEDLEGEYSMHVTIINVGSKSGVIKLQGKKGALFIKIFYEPTG
jgi:hypothetical protein